MANFVSELEAEVLAKKHLENYVNECRCQSKVDVLLAIQKNAGGVTFGSRGGRARQKRNHSVRGNHVESS